VKAHYDLYDYQSYWVGRDYENLAEECVLNTFFRKIPRGGDGLDIGSGFGRLALVYSQYAKEFTLLDPSQKNLSEARVFLKLHKGKAHFRQGDANKLPFKDSLFNFCLIVRVFHHLPDPETAMSEIYRVLKPGGYAVIEFANKLHFKNYLLALIRQDREFLKDLNSEDIRSEKNVKGNSIPFVNHHPEAILNLIKKHDLKVVDTRSVSNFRLGFLKRFVPVKILMKAEALYQNISSQTGWMTGPSIFILVQK
jgi:ubiquinone/menaquinone biosynthesis C-methylase UbiE